MQLVRVLDNTTLLFEKNLHKSLLCIILCKSLLSTVWILDIVSQSEETISVKIFLFKLSNRNSRKCCELGSELTIKTLLLTLIDFETMLTLSFSFVDFEQVNICCDVIKSLFSDYWSILKMLCIRFCPRPSNFYWHNAFMYSPFLNKKAGDINTPNTTK